VSALKGLDPPPFLVEPQLEKAGVLFFVFILRAKARVPEAHRASSSIYHRCGVSGKALDPLPFLLVSPFTIVNGDIFFGGSAVGLRPRAAALFSF
jgi:hypothetical protein